VGFEIPRKLLVFNVAMFSVAGLNL
jgi:hypothetical protein